MKRLQAEITVNISVRARINKTGQATAELDGLLPAILDRVSKGIL